MAELILSPIVEKIFGGLGSAAVKEIALLWGVHEELDELEETISTIKAVLLDAEEKKDLNNQVKNFLERLGGVVDEADNLVDEINTEALRRQVISGNEMAKKNPSEHQTELVSTGGCNIFNKFGLCNIKTNNQA